jgi:hypothetical protein
VFNFFSSFFFKPGTQTNKPEPPFSPLKNDYRICFALKVFRLRGGQFYRVKEENKKKKRELKVG